MIALAVLEDAAMDRRVPAGTAIGQYRKEPEDGPFPSPLRWTKRFVIRRLSFSLPDEPLLTFTMKFEFVVTPSGWRLVQNPSAS